MELQDIKKKTALVSGLITLISSIVAVAFLLTPKATIFFGIVAIIACSASAGFCFGTTYAERFFKKEEDGKRAIKNMSGKSHYFNGGMKAN